MNLLPLGDLGFTGLVVGYWVFGLGIQDVYTGTRGYTRGPACCTGKYFWSKPLCSFSICTANTTLHRDCRVDLSSAASPMRCFVNSAPPPSVPTDFPRIRGSSSTMGRPSPSNWCFTALRNEPAVDHFAAAEGVVLQIPSCHRLCKGALCPARRG